MLSHSTMSCQQAPNSGVAAACCPSSRRGQLANLSPDAPSWCALRRQQHRPAQHQVAAAAPYPRVPLKVVIAGAGISGLSLAVGLLKKGYEVVVLERDLTAIRGEGKYRGPIQVRVG